MDEDQIKRTLAEWIDEGDVSPELYKAYISGVNVGMEVEQSGRADEMSPEEFSHWLREMFETRVNE